jgi:hypothetical protein
MPINLTQEANGSLGPGGASSGAITVIKGTNAANGNTTLVAAPVIGRIVVCNFVIQNESAVATTMMLTNGAGGTGYRALGFNQGDGLTMVFPQGFEWRLTPLTALVMNLSGANSCGYSIGYFVEGV